MSQSRYQCPLNADLMKPSPCDDTSCPLNYEWKDERGCLSRALSVVETPSARLVFLLERGLTTHALLASQIKKTTKAARDLMVFDEDEFLQADHCPHCHYPSGYHKKCSPSLCTDRTQAVASAASAFVDVDPNPARLFGKVWKAVIANRASFLTPSSLAKMAELVLARDFKAVPAPNNKTSAKT